MSELTSPIRIDIPGVGSIESADLYLKSEADNVIAEKDAEIARLKAIRKVHVEAIASMEAGLRQDDKELRRQKYKRCLANTEACKHKRWRNDEGFDFARSHRQMLKWLELADKFKEQALNEHKHHLQRK